MSFDGMIERRRLERANEAGITECVAVVITGSARYEQDQLSLCSPNVRGTFPPFDATHEEMLEWADRY